MNLQQLQTQHAQLIEQLRADRFSENADNIVEQLRANEQEQKKVKIAARLEAVNRDQSRLREQARIIYQIEDVPADVICNDGTPHATKVKKYPNLHALKYVRVYFEQGKMAVIKYGKDWKMIDKTGQRPETFEDFLKLNSIQPADITPEELSAVIEANERINAEFKKACEKFSADKDALKIHSYSYLGLFTQHSVGHNYEYLVNY